MIRDSTRTYAQDKLMVRVDDAYATETTEPEIFTKMGLLGTTNSDTYRGLGAGFVTYGLVAREVEAVDSGYRSRIQDQSLQRNYSGRLQTMARKRYGLPIVCRGQNVQLFIQNYRQMRQRLSFARGPAALFIVIPLSLKMIGKHQRGLSGCCVSVA